MPEPQNLKNHTRWDPPYHFFLAPMLLINFGFSIYATIHAWPEFAHTHLWWIVMSFVFIVFALVTRGETLRAQDRLIRLEEQLRLADLVDEAHLGLIEQVTLQQYIALRFASDAEVAALALRAVKENLTPKQIKEAIVTWRPDYCRV